MNYYSRENKYKGSIRNIFYDLDLKGSKPSSGIVIPDRKRNILLAIKLNDRCYTKNYLKSKITINNKKRLQNY